MTTQNNRILGVKANLVPRGLTAAIAIALAGYVAAPAHAFEFGDADGFHGTINTTLSYGIDLRTSDPSADKIAKAHFNPLVGTLPNAQQRTAHGAFSANHDDGDLNYGSSGDVFSNAVKATSEFHLDYGSHMGAFVRASYFYDFENANNDHITSLQAQVKQITDSANSQADLLRSQFTATEGQLAVYQSLQSQLAGFFKQNNGG